MDPTQYTQFKMYFPGWRDAGHLPPAVRDWTKATRAELRQGIRTRPLRVLAVESTHSTLFFRYFPDGATGAAELRIMERFPTAGRWLSFELSPREREVLHWLAQGKRDDEIGMILGLSRRTIGKHVEHLLAKLRVTNRTAAAAGPWAG
jgi:DNA-binding CsgD family transcriptional regulator